MSNVMLTLAWPNLLLTNTGFWPLWSSTEAWKWRKSCKFDVSGSYTPHSTYQRPCEGHRVEWLAILIREYQVVVLVGPSKHESMLKLIYFVIV